MTLRSPLRWFGGKGSMAQAIVDLLPPHTHFCEPFFGGGSILFAKPPAAMETVNDLHQGLVTFYRVLRDPAQFAELGRLCALTPFSRVQWEECRALWPHESDPVRKAWAFFVVCRQVFSGDMENGGWQVVVSNPGDWAVSRYLSAIAGLPAIHARLRHVQVEGQDWRPVVARFSHADCLLYCDPPYSLGTRSGGARYLHEMDRAAHLDLTAALLETRSMVVLSGYRDEAIHSPLERTGWERRDLSVPNWAGNVRDGDGRTGRVESLWSNPAAVAARSQPSLFSSEEVPR